MRGREAGALVASQAQSGEASDKDAGGGSCQSSGFGGRGEVME